MLDLDTDFPQKVGTDFQPKMGSNSAMISIPAGPKPLAPAMLSTSRRLVCSNFPRPSNT